MDNSRTLDKLDVVLTGLYGAGNIGDDALMLSAVQALRARVRQLGLTILSRSPETLVDYRLDARLLRSDVIGGSLSTLAAIARSDALVLGGGGLLQDVSSFANVLFHLSRPCMALAARVPFGVLAGGIGPLNHHASRMVVGRVLERARVLSVRDDYSADLLARSGVARQKVHVDGDLALLLDAEGLPCDAVCDTLASWKASGRRIIGLSMRPDFESGRTGQLRQGIYGRVSGMFVEVARRLLRSDDHTTICLVSMHADQDDRLLGRLADDLDCPDRVVLASARGGVGTVHRAIGQLHALVGLRLHSHIFAFKQGVPSIGISYAPKVEGFFHYAGLADRLLPMAEASVEGILDGLAHIDDRHDELVRQLRLSYLDRRARMSAAVDRFVHRLTT